MAETVAGRVRRYILDGSDEDLRRLLGIAEISAEMARAAFGRLGVQPGWTAIDCGCGPIGGLAVMAEAVGPAGRVVGVDFNPAAVQRARAVVSALELGNVEVVAGDLHELDRSSAGRPVRSGLFAAVPDAPGRSGPDPAAHCRSPSPGRLARCARGAAYPDPAITPAPGGPHRLLERDLRVAGPGWSAAGNRGGPAAVRAGGGLCGGRDERLFPDRGHRRCSSCTQPLSRRPETAPSARVSQATGSMTWYETSGPLSRSYGQFGR